MIKAFLKKFPSSIQALINSHTHSQPDVTFSKETQTNPKIQQIARAPNPYAKKNDGNHTLRILGQNFRLFAKKCEHFSCILGNPNELPMRRIYISNRPFAAVKKNGDKYQYIQDADTSCLGAFTLQEFVKNQNSKRLCVVSMLSKDEVINKNKAPITSFTGGYRAINDSVTLPEISNILINANRIQRISIPLFDHTAIDPKTKTLVSWNTILAAVNQVQELRTQGYDIPGLLFITSQYARAAYPRVRCINTLLLWNGTQRSLWHNIADDGKWLNSNSRAGK